MIKPILTHISVAAIAWRQNKFDRQRLVLETLEYPAHGMFLAFHAKGLITVIHELQAVHPSWRMRLPQSAWRDWGGCLLGVNP